MRSIYPIGPIIRTVSGSELVDGSESDQCMCIRWLDNQATGCVLFVSFGSGGTLSYDRLKELALALELSEQKFCGSQEVLMISLPLRHFSMSIVKRTHSAFYQRGSWIGPKSKGFSDTL